MRVETDLNRPETRKLFEAQQLFGFTERDEPNFSFRRPPCSFHSGTKALAEESICEGQQAYIWRPRLPFNERDEPSNLLSKLQRYAKVYDTVNSLSHLGDCVRACLDLWERSAPFGIYNVTNPGAVTTRQVVDLINRILKPGRPFTYWMDDEEFYREGVKAPRSNCVLDVSKLVRAGVKMRSVHDALKDSLEKWQPVTPILRIVRSRPNPLTVAG